MTMRLLVRRRITQSGQLGCSAIPGEFSVSNSSLSSLFKHHMSHFQVIPVVWEVFRGVAQLPPTAQGSVRNYLRVAPGLLVVGNAAWIYAAGHRSPEAGPEFLMPWRDRLNSSMSLICFVRKFGCVCREERRILHGKPHGGFEQSVQGKELPCKKAKIKVSATACQRGLFFLENL